MGNKGENLFKVDNEDMKTISQTSLQYHRWSLDQVDRLPVFYVLVFLLLTVNIPWLLFYSFVTQSPPLPPTNVVKILKETQRCIQVYQTSIMHIFAKIR